jgi:hypothetical protein
MQKVWNMHRLHDALNLGSCPFSEHGSLLQPKSMSLSCMKGNAQEYNIIYHWNGRLTQTASKSRDLRARLVENHNVGFGRTELQAKGGTKCCRMCQQCL